MSVLDRFLNVMKLSPEEDYDPDEGYLDEPDDSEEEPQPARRILKNTRHAEEEEDLPDADEEEEEETRYGSYRKTGTDRAAQSTRSRSAGSKVSPTRSSRRSRTSSDRGMAVCVIKPHTMDDCEEITESLLAGSTVILNLEGLELELLQRVVDYTSGTCYAIDGNLQQISSSIIMVAPSTVEISGNFTELLTGAFDIPFDRKY